MFYLLSSPSDVTSPGFSWLGVVGKKIPNLEKAQFGIPGSGG